MARNTSSVQAENVELWVQICKGCTYSKEPERFEHPNGLDEHVRHRRFGDLNSKVFTDKMVIQVKPDGNLPFFDITFDYACRNCGDIPPWAQTIRVVVLH